MSNGPSQEPQSGSPQFYFDLTPCCNWRCLILSGGKMEPHCHSDPTPRVHWRCLILCVDKVEEEIRVAAWVRA